jgi:arsenate reductase
MTTFICYPKCSTCQKAEKYLLSLGKKYTKRHIVNDPLNEKELYDIYIKSGLPLRRFFNTSGMKYRELQLKDVLPTMNEAQQIALLASDGMLVKRPIVIQGDTIIIGFKPTAYDAL